MDLGTTPSNVIYAEMDIDNPDVFSCESMCPNCEKNGTTRMTLMRLNQHKEQIISSFSCPHCNHTNNDVQSGTEIQANGLEYTIKCTTAEDLNRQVIKTTYASFKVPEIDLEIPADSQEGLTTTMEGMLSRVVEQLSSEQPIRKHTAPEDYEAIENFINRVQALLETDDAGVIKIPFTAVLRDPSGLSNVEPHPDFQTLAQDPACSIRVLERTEAESNKMGFYKEETNMADIPANLRPEGVTTDALDNAGEFFKAPCLSCGYEEASQRFCEIDIPGFRRCMIMAFTCDRCGFKDSEVKPSGDIGDRGKKWTLRIESPEDLNRDLLKSDFAHVKLVDTRPGLTEDMMIPPIELTPGTLGALFTTVEGLCSKAAENLKDAMPFHGDSTQEGNTRALIWRRTIEGLKSYGSSMVDNETGALMFPFTLEVEDPVDHSFIGERQSEFLGEQGRVEYRPGHDDSQLHVEAFDRSAEQNEELGITDLMAAEAAKEN